MGGAPASAHSSLSQEIQRPRLTLSIRPVFVRRQAGNLEREWWHAFIVSLGSGRAWRLDGLRRHRSDVLAGWFPWPDLGRHRLEPRGHLERDDVGLYRYGARGICLGHGQ